MNLSKSDQHWFDLIQQCKTSGLSDAQWLLENNIKSPTFYYHIKKLREKAYEITDSSYEGRHEKQEVVPIFDDGESPILPVTEINEPSPIKLMVNGISIEIANNATRDVIKNTIAALRFLC